MKSFLKKQCGTVMMEYIIITSVFMLGVGGFCYLNSGYFNLLPGVFPQQVADPDTGTLEYKLHSSMTIGKKPGQEYLSYIPVSESERNVVNYGVVGDAFAAQTRKAQIVIAMPQL